MQINNKYMNQGIIGIGWVKYKYSLSRSGKIFISSINGLLVNQNYFKISFSSY